MDTKTEANLPIKPSVDEKILNAPAEDIKKYVLKRYEDSINYYWKNGGINKRTYRRNRVLVIVLGSLVTLFSSLLSASFIANDQVFGPVLAVITPLIAATLTIINGLTQSFQSGAAWRDMVLNAERLEKERDRFLATPDSSKNFRRELNILNNTILNESTAFFKRILDSEYSPENQEYKDDDK
jgi:hypothetical protein